MTSLEQDTDNDGVADITHTRSHNTRGDLTDDGELYAFTYDMLGRLVEVRHRTTGDLLSQYRYNGLGYRTGERIDADADGVLETAETGWRSFIYDPRWRLIEVYEDSDDVNPLEVYVHHAAGLDGQGTGSYIDHLILRERDTDADGILDEFHFYCQNWRADVVAILDEAGRQVEQVRYTPYGVPIAVPFAEQVPDGVLNFFDFTTYQARYNAAGYEVLADRDLDGDRDFFDFTGYQAAYNATPSVGRGVLSNYDHRFGYGGYWFVAERGLYHVRIRWYDPEDGRWLTRDPSLYIDSANLFSYTMNSPIANIDYTGSWISSLLGGAIGAAAGALVGGVSAFVASGGDFSATVAGAVGGAVTGGVGGALIGSGVPPALALAVSAELGAAAAVLVDSAVAKAKGKKYTGKDALKSAATGAGTAVYIGIGGGAVRQLFPACKKWWSIVIEEAISGAVGGAI